MDSLDVGGSDAGTETSDLGPTPHLVNSQREHVDAESQGTPLVNRHVSYAIYSPSPSIHAITVGIFSAVYEVQLVQLLHSPHIGIHSEEELRGKEIVVLELMARSYRDMALQNFVILLVAAVLLLIPPAFVSTSQVRLALLFVVISAANATWIAAAYYASITYQSPTALTPLDMRSHFRILLHHSGSPLQEK